MTQHPAATDDALMDLIAEEALLKRDEISRESRLDELDITSLDFMTIIFEVEDRYGVSIQDTEVEGCGTLGELIDRLKAKVATAH